MPRGYRNRNLHSIIIFIVLQKYIGKPRFNGNHNMPELIPVKIESRDKPILLEEIKKHIKELPTQKSARPRWFHKVILNPQRSDT